MINSRVKVIDISRPLSAKAAVYPGNPPVSVKKVRTFEKNGSRLSAITTGLHGGTHMDAPANYIGKGKTADEVDLSSCMGWARVVEIKEKEIIDENDIKRIEPLRNEILLFKTKNSRFSQKFNPKYAHLTEGAARLLVAKSVRAVGTDGPSIRKYGLSPDTVHPVFLRTETPVYEGLWLRDVRPGKYYFIGLPLKIEGAEASPVRAILIKN